MKLIYKGKRKPKLISEHDVKRFGTVFASDSGRTEINLWNEDNTRYTLSMTREEAIELANRILSLRPSDAYMQS